MLIFVIIREQWTDELFFELRVLERLEADEIERILSELSADIAGYGEKLKENNRNLTLLAFAFGKSQLSFRMEGMAPEITEKSEIHLVRARHPLISADSVVPITVSLGGKYDALIITGKQIKSVKNDGGITLDKSFEYKRQTKAEYLANLKGVFSRNKVIKVIFDDIKVVKHPVKDYYYGVTLKQGWRSDTYSDVGYVFLLIDFKDEMNPMIHVRTWQPEKYDDGTEVPERTEWHNVVLWRGLAETVEKYVHKGDKLFIEGKIRSRSYDDQNGVKRYITEIFADNMEMLTPRGQSAAQNAPAPAAAQRVAPAQGQNGKDDMPF